MICGGRKSFFVVVSNLTILILYGLVLPQCASKSERGFNCVLLREWKYICLQIKIIFKLEKLTGVEHYLGEEDQPYQEEVHHVHRLKLHQEGSLHDHRDIHPINTYICNCVVNRE